MEQRTVAQKMGVKTGSRAYLHESPVDAVKSMELPDLDRTNKLSGEYDYIHLFTKSQNDMKRDFLILRSYLSSSGALWVSWPKAGKLETDLTMKSVIKIGYDLNMVESKCIRIDETWSAIKFTQPKSGKLYKNSYGRLPVE